MLDRLPFFALPVGLSPFKQFTVSSANVSLGREGSLKIGLPRSTMKANPFYQGNAYAVIQTA
jgi:hypothetical protein